MQGAVSVTMPAVDQQELFMYKSHKRGRKTRR